MWLKILTDWLSGKCLLAGYWTHWEIQYGFYQWPRKSRLFQSFLIKMNAATYWAAASSHFIVLMFAFPSVCFIMFHLLITVGKLHCIPGTSEVYENLPIYCIQVHFNRLSLGCQSTLKGEYFITHNSVYKCEYSGKKDKLATRLSK